uniref:Uncharacterized protein n=1 Tax=Panagrolaimus davidi TaxID=227884 RepID=A0A914QEH2_9BILA
MAQDAASVLREMNNAITLLNKNMENVKWATYAQNLIGCGSIIGNLVVIGFSMFGNNANPIKEATQQLMNRLDGISQQITNATSELKDFVAQTNYCTVSIQL